MADNIIDTGTGTEVDIAGKTYKMSPLTIGSYKSVAAHIKKLRRQEIVAILNDLPETKERSAMVRELSRILEDSDVAAFLESLDGILYVLWCGINANHPEFKLEDFNLLSTNEVQKLKKAYKDLAEVTEKNEAGVKEEA